MNIRELSTIDGARCADGLVVIVDVFRACATACAIASGGPREYVVVDDDAEAAAFRRSHPDVVLVGKPALGVALDYDLPNSPSRVSAADLRGRLVVHRTMGGAAAILVAPRADEVITASYPNLTAVARYVRAHRSRTVSLVAVGHEGRTPADEDLDCCACLRSLIEGQPMPAVPMDRYRAGSGRYFFDGDQHEYPRGDFERCLEVDRFDFVLRAHLRGAHAVMEIVGGTPLQASSAE